MPLFPYHYHAQTKKFLLVALAVIVAVTLFESVFLRTGNDNMHVLQAAAFLHGRLDLAVPSHDVSVFHGRMYDPFPPLPAVLLMPLVALFGVARTNSAVVALLLTLLSYQALRGIFAKLEVGSTEGRWLCLALFLGTGYWQCLTSSAWVWYYAHIVAVAFLLLALNEALGRARGPLVGLLLGGAFLSRQMTLYALIFLLVAVVTTKVPRTSRARLLHALGLLASFAGCVLVYLFLNWKRFGSPLDTGYSHIPLSGFLEKRVAAYGIFSYRYVLFNLVSLFLEGFHINFSDDLVLHGIGMNRFGTSLTFASPFLFLAFRARWDTRLLRACWASICLVVLHMLFYYNNGYEQPNANRLALDFLPLLLLLVALGSKRAPPQLWKGAVIYSIVLNVIALGLIPLLALLGV